MPEENDEESLISNRRRGGRTLTGFTESWLTGTYLPYAYGNYSTDVNVKTKSNNVEDDEDMTITKSKNSIDLTQLQKKVAVCKDLHGFYYKNYSNLDNGSIMPLNGFINFRKYPNKNSKKSLYKSYEYQGIIIGYENKGKLYYNTKDIVSTRPKSTELYYLVYVTCSSDGEKVSYITKVPFLNARSINKSHCEQIIKTFKIKILSGELSGKVWGLSPIKNQLSGAVFSTYSIEYGSSKKIGETFFIEVNTNNIINSIEGIEPNIKLKFTLSDIQFILPNLKGYNPPLDKTIVVGSNVKVRDKRINVGDDAVLTVQFIKPNFSSQKISKNSNNRQLDVVLCSTSKGEKFRIYAKNLKLIHNATQKQS